jgi:hypothetical protein
MEEERLSQEWNTYEPAGPGLTGAVDLHKRPGVPEELVPPRPVGRAHWNIPEQQRSNATPLVGVNMELTPVYSTAIPPRGLSGAIRRAAYSVPEHRARRWLLLLVADRVDAIEHEPRTLAKVIVAIALVTAGVFAIRTAGKHRR